jgi:hypothetical protein
MVSGLASAREQLQWRLNYADKISHIAVGGFAECSYLFTPRTVFQSLRTEEAKTDASPSQSVGILQQAGAIEGQSKVASTGDPG